MVARQCNLRCRYCPVDKKRESMDIETAWRAVSLFLEEAAKGGRIRFFGGEPFLNLPAVKYILHRVGKKNGLRFDLTTNGSLLNKKEIDFFKTRPDLELILSSYGQIGNPRFFDKFLSLPNLTLNLNLWPDKLKNMPLFFKSLADSGFKRFNFLPAFYVPWTQKQVREMSDCLDLILKIIRSSGAIYVKNLEAGGPVPLFNTDLCVDCNGDIFQGNFFLDKRFSKLRPELKIGDIHSMNSLKQVQKFSWDFEKMVEINLSKKIISSTKQIDRELSRFCDSLKQ